VRAARGRARVSTRPGCKDKWGTVVVDAMMGMGKIDIAAIEAARRG
jgi:hypothetical protein